jgi:SAM-dependent methyltransferase
MTDLSRNFDGVAASYERGRPSYAPAAIAHLGVVLGIGPGARVLDLGAGTGKLTRQLVAAGATVTAVEPGPAMRAELVARVPGVPALDGTAEAIPLPDGAVDAITVAQAFHWFDPARALPEMARVLVPGGGLALLWNERDERTPWVAELTRITHWDRRAPFDIKTDWAAKLSAQRWFGPLTPAYFELSVPMTAALLDEMVRSRSYIVAMAPADRDAVLANVAALVRGWPEPFELPYITQVWTARRT